MRPTVAAIIVIGMLLPVSLGYSPGSPAYTHVTYMIVHANVFHMLGNLVCWLWLAPACSRWAFPSAVVAVLCSFIPQLQPADVTVGFSGVLFAMVGFLLGSRGLWRNMLATLALSTAVGILFTFVSSSGSVCIELHAWCLLLSYTLSRLWYRQRR